MEFLPGELERYNRHIILPQFGLQGQQKLKAAKVLIVGSGGLGSPLVLYLAAAGVGTIGIIDFDTVSESNLQRQVLFGTGDLGKSKAQTATEKIKAINPNVNVITYNEKMTSVNALEIIEAFDVIADGTDNFPTRYLVNDACVLSGKAYVYGSVFQFEGQVAVFNYKNADGSFGPNYRDLFPSPPPPELIPDCASGGVLGVLPGIIGSMQALEIIKLVTGIGESLSGKFLVFDALGFSTKTFLVKPNPNNPLNGTNPSLKALIDYEEFCNTKPIQNIKEITVQQFLELKSKGEEIQLIDVREPLEYEAFNLEGKLIPLKNILEHVSEIEHGKKVIIHCQSGVRSKTAINLLQQQFNFDNLYNLTGGIEAVLKISNIVKDRDKK